MVDLLPNRGAVAIALSEEEVRHSFKLMACHAREDLSGYYRLNAQIYIGINASA